MKPKDLHKPIIAFTFAYEDYPFERLDQTALEVIKRGTDQLDARDKKFVPRYMKVFECFLQVTSQFVSADKLSRSDHNTLIQQFIGAINSSHFIELSIIRRYENTRFTLRLLAVLSLQFPDLKIPDCKLSSLGRPSDYMKECIDKFEELDLDEEKVWMWQGWPATNRTGRTTWFRLYPIYRRLGRDFTERLYAICHDFYSARRQHRITALSELAAYIQQYPGVITINNFGEPRFVTRFWRDFLTYYIETGFAANVQISTLITYWRTEFVFFVKHYLTPAGLFAEPYGELPMPAPRYTLGAKTHIKLKEDGTEVKTKLLTHIPLNVTDKEAMKLLFQQVEADVNLIVIWSQWAVDDIWKRYQRRIDMAKMGRVRPIQGEKSKNNGGGWLTSRKNPEHLMNAAATFEHYGFEAIRELEAGLLFPRPLSQTAHELALPTVGSLLPHCVLLVANHPQITTSFLEKLELFDKDGKRVGLVQSDSGSYLDGHKDRKGAAKSQQIIRLTELTEQVVSQMIELTEPIRKYLKARGDDNWRYLLLSCSKAFGYPYRIRRLATDTSAEDRLRALAINLGATSDLNLDARMEFVRRFSLPALRASAGVLIYIKTKSASKMAEALGHTNYCEDLLARYLPEPIRAFFLERWIRIFQQEVLCIVLKESEFLLEASDFNNIEELNEFLLNHALKILPVHLDNPGACKNSASSNCSTDAEVVFGVNTGILTTMISLQKAVEKATKPVSGIATYWALITERLVNFIRSDACHRDDLKECLQKAELYTNISIVEHIIYD